VSLPFTCERSVAKTIKGPVACGCGAFRQTVGESSCLNEIKAEDKLVTWDADLL